MWIVNAWVIVSWGSYDKSSNNKYWHAPNEWTIETKTLVAKKYNNND